MSVGKGSLARAAKVNEKVSAPNKKAVEVLAMSGGADAIHEKKFEAISKITCDLPIYLL